VIQKSRGSVQVNARDLNAVERGIRGYQANAEKNVKNGQYWAFQCKPQERHPRQSLLSLQPDQLVYAAAEGKYADDGSGGGNGVSYGLLAAISLGTAGILAFAPHTVSYAQ